MEMEQYSDAIKRYERALQLQPDIPDTHHALGLAHLKSENMADALKHCDLLHELDIDKENDLRKQIAQFQK